MGQSVKPKSVEQQQQAEPNQLLRQTQGSNQLGPNFDDLDSILDSLPTIEPPEEQSAVIMSMDAKNEANAAKPITEESNNNNNNNNNKHLDMLDDLTNQLVTALDTSDVVGWKPSEESPFGNCGSCGISIDGEASVVGEIHFHPKCFVCADCKNPLGTAKYYIIGGKNYCEQCRYKYLEKCTKCDKVIENETVRPKGSGKPYHTDCFCCVKCEQPLQGKYFTNETGMICENCFAASREKCARCGRAIMESTLKALDQVYHPKCFVCSMCPKSLEGVEFFVTEDKKPMCKECFARYMAKTCSKCDQKITEETMISTTDDKFYHQNCYTPSKITA